MAANLPVACTATILALLVTVACNGNPQPATETPPVTPPVTPSATPATQATEKAASPTPDAQLTFTVVGDVGSHEQAQATLATMGAQDADFHLMLGDLSYAGPGSEPGWCGLVQSLVGETPVQLVAGNHESDTGRDGHIGEFAKCLPDRMSSTGRYGAQYYFDAGKLARVIMLAPGLTIDGRHYFYGENNENLQFLEQAIDEARTAGIRWIIVGTHKPCISVGVYHCEMHQEMFNVLVDRKVDMVVSGHDHNYQRSHQVGTAAGCPVVEVDEFDPSCILDDGEDGVYEKGAGALFVVSGTGGAQMYDVNPDDPEAGYFAIYMGKNHQGRKGFMRVKLTDEELEAEFVGTTEASNFSDAFRITY